MQLILIKHVAQQGGIFCDGDTRIVNEFHAHFAGETARGDIQEHVFARPGGHLNRRAEGIGEGAAGSFRAHDQPPIDVGPIVADAHQKREPQIFTKEAVIPGAYREGERRGRVLLRGRGEAGQQ